MGFLWKQYQIKTFDQRVDFYSTFEFILNLLMASNLLSHESIDTVRIKNRLIFCYSMNETMKNLEQKRNKWKSEQERHSSALTGKDVFLISRATNKKLRLSVFGIIVEHWKSFKFSFHLFYLSSTSSSWTNAWIVREKSTRKVAKLINSRHVEKPITHIMKE